MEQLTTLVSQLMEERAGQVDLPASPPQVSAPVPVTMLEMYDGNSDQCQAFLIQCGLYIEEHPESFTEETARVRLAPYRVCTRLGYRAVDG